MLDNRQIIGDVARGVQILTEARPEMMQAFQALNDATVEGDEPLDSKTKELIAIAVSIATHCEGCVAWHTRKAVDRGATRAEVVAAVGVAIYLGGGPATVYGAQAVAAFDEFTQT